ncbi:DUF962 domain-containing protein [Myxococcota bacterium]|nr:DUF962 domain-containing protein [Myxococcota bacterium]
MKTLTDHLASYASYHRDRRNLATHFVGIPMIVVAVATLLSRPTFELGAYVVSPAPFVFLGAVIFYSLLDRPLSTAMAIVAGATVWLGSVVAAGSTAVWLAVGVGLFVVGWAIQFLGHYFEGRKPAFVDDLVGLLIGPLFIVTEIVMALGLRGELKKAIEDRAGPTVIRERKRADASA